MTNRKIKLTISNMVVMLALLAALVGVSWQQVGAQRGTPADECSAKVEKLADKDAARSDCQRNEKSEKRDHGMETIANLIGIDVDTLWGELKAGNSIADVAQANGVDAQTIIDALVAQKQAKIDELLAAGEISAEKAAAWQAKLVEGVTSFVNDTYEDKGDGRKE